MTMGYSGLALAYDSQVLLTPWDRDYGDFPPQGLSLSKAMRVIFSIFFLKGQCESSIVKAGYDAAQLGSRQHNLRWPARPLACAPSSRGVSLHASSCHVSEKQQPERTELQLLTFVQSSRESESSSSFCGHALNDGDSIARSAWCVRVHTTKLGDPMKQTKLDNLCLSDQ